MVSTGYVAALEPDTGKSVIALGMMEAPAGRTDRVEVTADPATALTAVAS